MEVHKKNQILTSFCNDQKFSHQSKHFLLELYRCDYEKLNDESFLRCTLNNAAKMANATVLNLTSNKFEPYGVTAIALLAESYIVVAVAMPLFLIVMLVIMFWVSGSGAQMSEGMLYGIVLGFIPMIHVAYAVLVYTSSKEQEM